MPDDQNNSLSDNRERALTFGNTHFSEDILLFREIGEIVDV